MLSSLPLAPRYRLDDESDWLIGVDPLRRYWLRINGDQAHETAMNGLPTQPKADLRPMILAYRNLQPGESLQLANGSASPLEIHCISRNCLAIATQYQDAPVWHLFDQESLESLLMTAHPDWQCAPQHLELGQKLLRQSLAATLAA